MIHSGQDFPVRHIFLFLSFYAVSGKAQGQKLLQGILPEGKIPLPQNDPEALRITEFHHHLAADAAGRTKILRLLPGRSSHDGNGRKSPFSFTDGFKKRGPLRAAAGAKGRVFNVAVANQEREKAGLPNPVVHDTEAAIKVGVEAIRVLIKEEREKNQTV